ncbi:MAG: class I SAM-dependent methyltransferase [Kofleriaceae bacterium]
MQRNQNTARVTALVATIAALPAAAKCLDYGGGHGVLVRMLRDIGLDFAWFDKYAENLFARGFEGDVDGHHQLVTAFEVLEHLAEVDADLTRLFAPEPDLVLVGTELHSGYKPGWWYFMLESGQHIVFYGARTMAWIGERFGYEAIVGPEYTVFVRAGFQLGAMRRQLLNRIIRRPVTVTNLLTLIPAPLLRRLSRYESRTEADHAAMRTRAP